MDKDISTFAHPRPALIWIRPKFVRRPVFDRPRPSFIRALLFSLQRQSRSFTLLHSCRVHLPHQTSDDASEKDRQTGRQSCRRCSCCQRPGHGTGPITGCYPRGFIQQAVRCPLCRQAESKSTSTEDGQVLMYCVGSACCLCWVFRCWRGR